MESKDEIKWHKKPSNIIIALFIFFPVGIYFMWKNQIWTKNIRWVITGVFIGLVLTANTEEYSSATLSFKKPTICECHTAFMDDVREAMSGDATTSSKTDECSKYYSTEEMTYADENNGC